jgi:CubicO group peptidase (beta-lactamase class C family)
LHKGNWNGEQVLDESWVKYSQNLPIHLRVNMDAILAECWRKFPDVPREMYYCSGFQGQMVAIIPSLDLVIVVWVLKKTLNLTLTEC